MFELEETVRDRINFLSFQIIDKVVNLGDLPT